MRVLVKLKFVLTGVTCTDLVEDVLHLLTMFSAAERLFQQDNASPHCALVTGLDTELVYMRLKSKPYCRICCKLY